MGNAVSQLKPLQRAGNRRYYRPADVALVSRIARLLNEEGYTIRGVQQLLASRERADAVAAAPPPAVTPHAELLRIRDVLAEALAG